MKFIPGFLAVVAAGTLVASVEFQRTSQADTPLGWKTLEPGLALGAFLPAQRSPVGDSRVRILKIDPQYFKFRLLNASAPDQGRRLSVRDWVRRNGLVAGINASMYQKDMRTSVSLMKTGNHVNSSWVSKDKTLLVFDPQDADLPPVQLVDRDCEDFDQIRKQYRTLIQSIRMVSCRGENVWAQQPNKQWSAAAIGMDDQNRILFIHVRSPYTTHDLINILLELPIGLQRAMYVEGGVEAQLYIRSRSREYEFLGSYSSGSHESDDNTIAWPVPNVVGIERVP